MTAALVQFPAREVDDIPRMLRNLADGIEQGKHGESHNLAWVLDCGDGEIKVGLLGTAAELAPTLHYLLALGLRKVEDAASG